MKTSIIWFTTNLRIHDNKPLLEAIAHSDQILPVFILDKSNFESTQFGTKKMGDFRLKFLLESLDALDQSLKELGSGLYFEVGDTKEIITSLVEKYHVSSVYVTEPPAYEEKKLVEEIEKRCWFKKCTLNTYETTTLFELNELPFPLKNLPDVFTKFRTIIEKECIVKSPLPAPLSIKSPAFEPFRISEELQGEIARLSKDDRSAFPFLGGHLAAHARLNSYFFETNSVSKYKETRNELIGADYSTKFSPWLALGCISPREIIEQLNTYETEVVKNESTYWVYFELLWREYFHWAMRKYGEKFFFSNGIKAQSPLVRKIQMEQINIWKNGQTGNEFVDANMRELMCTGFMSNRGRQNVASYFCNDMQLDWRFGASYFEEQLLDYDVCSNWCNWAYIAGVGNDPKGHRTFNLEKQAKEYDKFNNYRTLWIA
jgi:deoxyribodipyrimidine photo-lyase